MISLQLNVSKIDKKRLFEGTKGVYLNAILIETPNSEYGDYMIKQSVSKEEREQGIEGNILGSAKIIVKREPQNYNNPPDAMQNDPDINDNPDLPF